MTRRARHSLAGACAVGALLAAVTVVIMVLLSRSASAEAISCMRWSDMAALLERAGEKAVGGGLISDTLALQVFASPNGETFSVVAINARGVGCLVAMGRDWDLGAIPQKPGAEL